MLKIAKILMFTFLFSIMYAEKIPEQKIVVVIPSYNNKQWVEKNLQSIFMQKYSKYRVIFINDCSTDETGQMAADYIQENGFSSKVLMIHNDKRVGAMANIYTAVQSCDDSEIIVLVDGDDWLYHPDVFNELNELYSTGHVWFTHGCLMEYPWGNVTWSEPVPISIMETKAYRTYKCPSHLRTFYTWLFKKIKLEDFLYEGEFLPMTWDMAIMYPLLEMAEERHAYISKVNYVYNMSNPINDNKVDPDLQNHLDRIIRNRPPYQRWE